MPRKSRGLDGDDEVLRRCRRVRQELYRRFKTPAEICAWLQSLEKEAGARHGKARSRAVRRSASLCTNGRPRKSHRANGRAKLGNKRVAQKI